VPGKTVEQIWGGGPPSGASPFSLQGQVALITGASSGIGRAIALELAAAGADIAINFIGDERPAQALAAKIRKIGRQALLTEGDVGDEVAVSRIFHQTVGHFGTMHILVSNAGIQDDSPLAAMSLQQWNATLVTNLTGQFLCMREAIREFLRRGVARAVSAAAGKIVCISSIHQNLAWAGHANYAASKGGVMMLVKSAALELAAHRIRINGIAPGAIRTPINSAVWHRPEALKTLESIIPYGRIGEPEDVARAALWLASDASDYVTGATLEA
jgi:glucose 1-dehydrogenase